MKTILKKKLLSYIFILILGVLSSFSLPPYNFFLINFITIPALFIFLIKQRLKLNKIEHFFYGWIFGFGYFISSLYWLTHSLTFEEIYKPLIPFALILIPLFLGIFYGLTTLISSMFNLNNKISSILIFSIIFGSVEYIRGFVLSGFPWNLIVFSLTEYLPMIQILSLVGTYSLNLLVISIFLIPSVIFFKYRKKEKLIFIFSTLLLLIFNYLYGLSILKKDLSVKKTDLNFLVKIVSPKIEINKFFQSHI